MDKEQEILNFIRSLPEKPDVDLRYIYRWTNKSNNKVYIGQTNNPYMRWFQYKYDVENCKALDNHRVIIRALNKYGISMFKFEIIATAIGLDNINRLEVEIIKQYNSTDRDCGYNMEAGGDVVEKSEETRKRISAGLRKYYEMNDGWSKGKKLSEAHRLATSIGSMGKPGTNNGKTFSDEHRLKMSKSLAGKEYKHKRRFNDEIESQICQEYIGGMSSNKLGVKYNCQRSLILKVLQRNNIKTRKTNNTMAGSAAKRIFSDEQELEICNIYLKGQDSFASLSRKYKCGKNTIKAILIRRNIIKTSKNKI